MKPKVGLPQFVIGHFENEVADVSNGWKAYIDHHVERRHMLSPERFAAVEPAV